MSLDPQPALLQTLFWVTLLAVIVSSASGVLKAGSKQFDLFGVIMIAIATGLGGGSMRDMLLDRPVFWIHHEVFFVASIGSAVAMFVAARKIKIPEKAFLIADAAGLATFAVAGTLASLMVNAPWLVSSFMGVMTGILGGVFRDVLCNDSPVVFHSPLYATLSWGGSIVFVALLYLSVDIAWAAIICGGLIFVSRLLAFHFNVCLPKFRFKT